MSTSELRWFFLKQNPQYKQPGGLTGPGGSPCALKIVYLRAPYTNYESFCEDENGHAIFPLVDDEYRMTIRSGAKGEQGAQTPLYEQDYAWTKKYRIVFLDTKSCLRGSGEERGSSICKDWSFPLC